MIINGSALLQQAPIRDMIINKVRGPGGTSWGLGEVGYDICLKQEVVFSTRNNRPFFNRFDGEVTEIGDWRFCIASAIEEFDMPNNLCAIVHDKSTWARHGLSVFNTVIEPGFIGGLTLELVYHGMSELHIPAGSGIAQVIFHQISERAQYNGKYQFQSSNPEPARHS